MSGNPMNKAAIGQDTGASASADQALVASDEARSDLHPPGFDSSRRLEFRPDHKGRFDEIVARFADGMVHVETMSKKGCYVGFYWDDGRYCQWWISSKEKLRYNHEDGDGPAPRFTAWDVDRTPSHLAIAMEAQRGGTPKSGPTAEGGDSAGLEEASPSPDRHTPESKQ